MMIEIGYVCSHGTHLVGEAFRQFNYVHTSDVVKWKTQLDDEVPITNYYSGQTAALLAQVYQAGKDLSGNFVLPRSLLLKPYPFYGALSTLQNNTAFDGTSIYHGMNLRVQKRFSHGLDFIAAYTVAKKIANAEAGELQRRERPPRLRFLPGKPDHRPLQLDRQSALLWQSHQSGSDCRLDQPGGIPAACRSQRREEFLGQVHCCRPTRLAVRVGRGQASELPVSGLLERGQQAGQGVPLLGVEVLRIPLGSV